MRLLIFLFVLFTSISKAQVVTKQLPSSLLTTEGTYTPTITSVTSNYSVSPFLARYQIVGNTVYVNAFVNVVQIAGDFQFNFSLPIIPTKGSFLAYQIGSIIGKDGKGEVFENGNTATVYVRAETNKSVNNSANYNLNFSYTLQ